MCTACACSLFLYVFGDELHAEASAWCCMAKFMTKKQVGFSHGAFCIRFALVYGHIEKEDNKGDVERPRLTENSDTTRHTE